MLWAQFPLALTRDLPHCWGMKVGPSLPLPKVSPVLKAFVPVTMSQCWPEGLSGAETQPRPRLWCCTEQQK